MQKNADRTTEKRPPGMAENGTLTEQSKYQRIAEQEKHQQSNGIAKQHQQILPIQSDDILSR